MRDPRDFLDLDELEEPPQPGAAESAMVLGLVVSAIGLVLLLVAVVIGFGYLGTGR